MSHVSLREKGVDLNDMYQTMDIAYAVSLREKGFKQTHTIEKC